MFVARRDARGAGEAEMQMVGYDVERPGEGRLIRTNFA